MQKTMSIKPTMLTLKQNMDLNSSHASGLDALCIHELHLMVLQFTPLCPEQ